MIPSFLMRQMQSAQMPQMPPQPSQAYGSFASTPYGFGGVPRPQMPPQPMPGWQNKLFSAAGVMGGMPSPQMPPMPTQTPPQMPSGPGMQPLMKAPPTMQPMQQPDDPPPQLTSGLVSPLIQRLKAQYGGGPMDALRAYGQQIAPGMFNRMAAQ